MKTLLKLISFAGLALMFVSAILRFNQTLSQSAFELLGLLGTALWFIPVPFWMKRRLHQSD
jgi:hypothetical protein